MTPNGWLCVGILAVTVGLFISDRLRLDVVAMLSLMALALGGLVTPSEALAGFASPVVIMIGGLFIVGAGLSETGIAESMGKQIGRMAGSGSELRLIMVVMAATALLSGFMSSTGTVAVLLPVVLTVAKRSRVSPTKLLMPMAFAALLGGMLTLIGTPPNVVVSDQLRGAGYAPFRFFSFLPAGLVMLLLGAGFMAVLGRRLLPSTVASSTDDDAPPRSVMLQGLVLDYALDVELCCLEVAEGSPLIGKSLAEANLRADFEVNVVGIHSTAAKPRGTSRRVVPASRFQKGDVLHVQGSNDAVTRMAEAFGLSLRSGHVGLGLPNDESLAEAVLPRRSRLVGKSLMETRFRDRYRATVLAIRRGDTTLHATSAQAFRTERLRAGDTLLIKGQLKYLRLLASTPARDLVLLTDLGASGTQAPSRLALVAVAITVGMLLLMSFGVVPNVIAVMVAALAMVVTGCVRAPDAYRAIHWESIVLIAGVLPMATALDKTGVMRATVDGMLNALGDAGPIAILASLFILTSVFSQVISNTATTVLVAPIALSLALKLGFAPEPFLMTVAIGASTAFATPIASPVNTLVLGPGGYKFGDFFRVGVPLQLIILVATLIVVPVLFPL